MQEVKVLLDPQQATVGSERTKVCGPPLLCISTQNDSLATLLL